MFNRILNTPLELALNIIFFFSFFQSTELSKKWFWYPEAAVRRLKERLQHKCFPVNISKFLRTAFFIEQLQWLLLGI